MRRAAILALLTLALPALAQQRVAYHARIAHVADHRDTYMIQFLGRSVQTASWECRLIAERRTDADPSGMLAGGPTIVPPDIVLVGIEPGSQRAGNEYWCRVWITDGDLNRVAAELNIAVGYPR